MADLLFEVGSSFQGKDLVKADRNKIFVDEFIERKTRFVS